MGDLLCRALPVPALYRLAHFLADVCFAVRASAREAVCGNLRVVLGPRVSEARVRTLGRRVFRNFAEGIVDFLRLGALPPGELEQAFEVEGREHLEQAVRSGSPVLFLTGHLGNWEWGAAWLGRKGVLKGVVAQRHPAQGVERLFRERREAFGLRVFTERDCAPGVLGVLRAGGTVGMLGDRDVTHDGTRADFFGRPTRVPRAHVSLALRSGAVILPGFVLRQPDGRQLLIFEPPLDPRVLGGREGGVDACLKVLEKYIRRYPEQWMVFEPVWPDAGGGLKWA
ncbi:MAG: lysophospholipid acyltransferase family protein [Candidatus Eisenbacteria bacterium]|nr:lysophospholipid acyltransferase family protein [Candidatus Eisenbacteria bacterium]